MKIISLPADDPISDTLYEALNAFSQSLGHYTGKRVNDPYLFIAQDENGNFLGGIQGGIYGGWLDVYTLYSTRQVKGVGSKLMDHVEAYAQNKGCKGIKLLTFEFQAPEFYKKRGYEIYGQVPDLVENRLNIYMKKDLG